MKRIGCVHLPYLVVEIARRQHAPGPGPLLVLSDQRVLGACQQAMAAGVHVGDPWRQALARCPGARVVQGDPAHCQYVWEQLLESMAPFSPIIEDEEWGVAYLEAAGMGALYGNEAHWGLSLSQQMQKTLCSTVHLGIAGSKYASWVAARSCAPGAEQKIISQEDRHFLAPYALHWLPLGPDVQRRLRLLGIRTVGQFAALPRNAVAEQFGPECLTAHAWARGKDERPLLGLCQRGWEMQHEFDPPECQQGPLLETLIALSGCALDDMRRDGLSIRRAELEARLADGASYSRAAWVGLSPGPATWRSILTNLLSGLRGECLGVSEVKLRWVGLEPARNKQLDLFAHTEGRTRLEQTLHSLAQKHPARCVAQICELAPEAPLLADHYGLTEYRP